MIPHEPEPKGLVLCCDMDGRITKILKDDVGVTRALALHKPFPLLVTPDDIVKALEMIAAVGHKRALFGWEITVNIDGQPTLLHFDACLVDEQIMVIGNVPPPDPVRYEDFTRLSNRQTAMIRDISQSRPVGIPGDGDVLEEFIRVNNELSTMQRQLARRNAELAEASEQKDLMLGMAAHDLRSPLNVIGGYAELLEILLRDRLSERERLMLQSIQSSSRYMEGLVDTVLQWAQSQNGRLVLHRTRCDLEELVALVAALEGVKAAQRQIGIHCQFPPVTMDLDAHKIQQVLHNLIGNALKYSPEGGTVGIRGQWHGPTLQVEITDDGPGIPDAEQEQLFQPFARGSTRPMDGTGSIGLGLAICRNIVQAHGGLIGCDSTPGRGTRMWFTLPGVTEDPC